eukprot:CAMPEP_0182447412 /NCGR_PEP_ID=MMETSP1172-20130603/15797_1 /TAXON_ID=708627 /ORGANISM="Timspurckia oligopyrenoides, Strain CCMP3278" /LENGTH=803 /DNA_ID=CAMNT_0024643843 /DNA_START=68 /DNA_END=2479 /DNA_ORIENTATION=-
MDLQDSIPDISVQTSEEMSGMGDSRNVSVQDAESYLKSTFGETPSGPPPTASPEAKTWDDGMEHIKPASFLASKWESIDYEKDFEEKEKEIRKSRTAAMIDKTVDPEAVEEHIRPASTLASKWENVDYEKDFEDAEKELRDRERAELAVGREESRGGVMAMAGSFKAWAEDEGKKDETIPDLAEIKRRKELARQESQAKSEGVTREVSDVFEEVEKQESSDPVAVGGSVAEKVGDEVDESKEVAEKVGDSEGGVENAEIAAAAVVATEAVEEGTMEDAEPTENIGAEAEDSELVGSHAEPEAKDLGSRELPVEQTEDEIPVNKYSSDESSDEEPEEAAVAAPLPVAEPEPEPEPEPEIDPGVIRARDEAYLAEKKEEQDARINECFDSIEVDDDSPKELESAFMGSAPDVYVTTEPVELLEAFSEGDIADAVFVNERLAFIAGCDGRVALWDLNDLSVLVQFQPHDGEDVAFLHLLPTKKPKTLSLMTLSKETRELKTWEITKDSATAVKSMSMPPDAGEITINLPIVDEESIALVQEMGVRAETQRAKSIKLPEALDEFADDGVEQVADEEAIPVEDFSSVRAVPSVGDADEPVDTEEAPEEALSRKESVIAMAKSFEKSEEVEAPEPGPEDVASSEGELSKKGSVMALARSFGSMKADQVDEDVPQTSETLFEPAVEDVVRKGSVFDLMRNFSGVHADGVNEKSAPVEVVADDLPKAGSVMAMAKSFGSLDSDAKDKAPPAMPSAADEFPRKSSVKAMLQSFGSGATDAVDVPIEREVSFEPAPEEFPKQGSVLELMKNFS